jgi:hypothetical protein
MGFVLFKEDARCHEVVSYRKVQNFFSFLVLIVISKTSMYPLKLSSSCTNMTIKIAFYEEFSLLGTSLTMSCKFF